MTSFTHDKFNILETFKSTAVQDIYIATVKEAEGSAVVVNVIKDENLINLIEDESLITTMSNLIHLERREEQLIIATRVLDAEPLLVYLDENYVPIKHRMDLAFQYLSEIIKYDQLCLPIKNILIDEAQLVVKDGRLAIDELIVADGGLDLDNVVNIGEKVSLVLNKIIFFDYRNLQQEELLLAEVKQFIDDLKERQSGDNLRDIFTTFRKLYIYHYCMEGIDSIAEEAPLKPYRAKALALPQGEKKAKKWPIMVALALLLTVGVYGITNLVKLFPERILQGEEYPQEEARTAKAHFRIEEEPPYWKLFNESLGTGEGSIEAYLWEISYQGKVIQTTELENPTLTFSQGGTYTISLKILDKQDDGVWSEPHIEEIEVESEGKQEAKEGDINQNDKFYTLSTKGQNNIVKDTNYFYEAPYSFKLTNDTDIVPTFTLRDFSAKEYESLSMLIRTSQEEALKIHLMVYNQGKVLHREELLQSVKKEDDWKLVSLKLPMVAMEEIKFEVAGFQNPIWIDSVELQPYK